MQRVVAGRQALMATVQDEGHRAQEAEYVETRRMLARLTLAPAEADRQKADARAIRLQELVATKERLERELASAIPEFRRQLELNRSRPEELTATLPAGRAYVDLLRYTHWEQDPDQPGKAGETRTGKYVAFVLQKDRPFVRIELAEAAPIDAAVRNWREAIAAEQETAADEQLRQLAWTPLEKHFAPGTRIYDGPHLRRPTFTTAHIYRSPRQEPIG